ncbi:hypothetical protein PMAYCL1PPCAC_07806, partial [Pristionchus mayeri]
LRAIARFSRCSTFPIGQKMTSLRFGGRPSAIFEMSLLVKPAFSSAFSGRAGFCDVTGRKDSSEVISSMSRSSNSFNSCTALSVVCIAFVCGCMGAAAGGAAAADCCIDCASTENASWGCRMSALGRHGD